MTQTAAEIWRDYELINVPSSGANKPDKAEIRAWGTLMEDLRAGVGIAYVTLSLLALDLAHPDGTLAMVYSDPVPTNNGLYKKSGASGTGSWTRIGDSPNDVIRLTVTGGTANALTVTTPETPSVPGDKLYLLTPTAANTGAVTITVNGGTPAVVNNAVGASMAANAMMPGLPILMAWQVDHYQTLVSLPVDASGVLNDTLAARDAAAASATAAAASAASLGNQVHQYDTRAQAIATSIPAGVVAITVARYAAGYRLASARYIRGAGPGSLVDAAGATWSLDLQAATIRAAWFGVRGDNTNDDYAAMQACANAAAGYSVQIEGKCMLSQSVAWPSNCTVYGLDNTQDGFVAQSGKQINSGLAYLNNKTNVRFLCLGFFGNLLQPPTDNYFYGAVYFNNDNAGSGSIQLEVSDCYFRDFMQTGWIGVVIAAQTGATDAIRAVKILRNEVYAVQQCMPTDLGSHSGNYFLSIIGNTAFDEPSLSGVVTNVIFAQNQIYGLGLCGAFEGTFNQANISITDNVMEFLANAAPLTLFAYGIVVYNSHPSSIDPYNVTVSGNIINACNNCACYLAGVRYAAVQGNVFRNVTSTALSVSLPSGFAIAFNGCQDVTCTGNVITDSPGGIYYGQDKLHLSTDSIVGNICVCVTDPHRNATGIMIAPDVYAALTDNQTQVVCANNNVTVSGASAQGIVVVGNYQVGRVSLFGNHVKSTVSGIVGQAVIGVVELVGNSVSGTLTNYPYLFSSTTPLIVKGELVDFGDVVTGSSPGASFDNCTNLMINGLTLLNKTNAVGALSMSGSHGTLQGVTFRNCATQAVAGAGQLGQALPTFAGSLGNFVQNLLPAPVGATGSQHVVDGWINLSNASTWNERQSMIA